MQPITITLNGRVVSGQVGMTILDIAREVGVQIPTLCHDENLAPVGACRLCLVENEATGGLLASCVTPISPGLVLQTHSPRVVEHRKTIIKLLLASHPDSCLVCDKGNRCRLHQIASDMGIGVNELERLPLFAAVQERNPFITRDPAKCVLCGKCIRGCREVVVEGVVDYYQRGFQVKPATLLDTPLEQSECTFCGTCVALCPTGALMEKEGLYRGTARKSVETTCAYCACGCPLVLEVLDDRVVGVSPGKGFPNRGALCVRGSYGYDYIHSEKRLLTPLIRQDGGFRQASWDEALETAAAAFQAIKERRGPAGLAVYGSARCTNEENYLLQRFARTVFHTNNIDNGSSLSQAAVRAGLQDSLGFYGVSNLLDTLEEAGLVMLVGADPSAVAPQVAYAVKRGVKFKGVKLILMDPRVTRFSRYAHIQLSPRPGTEPALLNGMARVIIREGLFNREFIERKTDGFKALEAALENWEPEVVEEWTGVPAERVREAARLYASSGKQVILFGSGITQIAGGSSAVRALVNLALLTGNLWGRGSGVYPLQLENNGLGACDMGALPHTLPGYRPVEEDGARDRFSQQWQHTLPSEPGLTLFEFLGRDPGRGVAGLYVVGENPLAAIPRSSQVASALSGLDFLLVQDLFLTETARLAHVVLPAASFAEKEGTFTNFEGRVGRLRQALPPAGSSRPDWEILLLLAKKMGSPLPYVSLEQIQEEIEELVPLYEGYSRPEAGWSFWENRRQYILDSLSGFPRFSAVQPGRPKSPSGEYPLRLLLEPVLPHFGSGARTGEAWRLKRALPASLLKIGAEDARIWGFKDEDRVRITSPHGSLHAAVVMAAGLPPGTVSLPSSCPEALSLFGTAWEEGGKAFFPEDCHVKLERGNG